MPIEIAVPRLGWSSEEGTFAGWLKQNGDQVVTGEPLFALESDKVTMEVESLDDGTLHIPAGGPESGATVKPGDVIGYLLAQGEQSPQSPGAVPASPRARARARSLGLDIADVRPAPGARRVVEADVLRARAASAGQRASGPRQVIAERLEESFRAPHFYVQAEADATFLARTLADLRTAEAPGKVRLTYNDLFVKAIARALGENPAINSQWREGRVEPLDSIGIGLAVQGPRALLVPVIRHADTLSLDAIAAARQALVERCTRGAISAAELAGGSVTLSNLGPFGVDRFQAILNPPQSAIVAIGRVAKRPFVDGDAVVARLTVPITISVDHRVVDGVAAARFLGSIVQAIESPIRLLL
jgi:pyruvate dehydrogenase E2 component (dihydrolipoamide acetyltransferase)